MTVETDPATPASVSPPTTEQVLAPGMSEEKLAARRYEAAQHLDMAVEASVEVTPAPMPEEQARTVSNSLNENSDEAHLVAAIDYARELAGVGTDESKRAADIISYKVSMNLLDKVQPVDDRLFAALQSPYLRKEQREKYEGMIKDQYTYNNGRLIQAAVVAENEMETSEAASSIFEQAMTMVLGKRETNGPIDEKVLPKQLGAEFVASISEKQIGELLSIESDDPIYISRAAQLLNARAGVSQEVKDQAAEIVMDRVTAHEWSPTIKSALQAVIKYSSDPNLVSEALERTFTATSSLESDLQRKRQEISNLAMQLHHREVALNGTSVKHRFWADFRRPKYKGGAPIMRSFNNERARRINNRLGAARYDVAERLHAAEEEAKTIAQELTDNITTISQLGMDRIGILGSDPRGRVIIMRIMNSPWIETAIRPQPIPIAVGQDPLEAYTFFARQKKEEKDKELKKRLATSYLREQRAIGNGKASPGVTAERLRWTNRFLYSLDINPDIYKPVEVEGAEAA